MKIVVDVKIAPEFIQVTTNNSSNPAPEDVPVPHAAFKADQCFQGSTSQALQIIEEGFLAQRALRSVHDVVHIQHGDEITLSMEVDDDEIAALLIALRMGGIFNRAFPQLIPQGQLELDISKLEKLETEIVAENYWIDSIAHPATFEAGFNKDFLRRVPMNERQVILQGIHGLKPPTMSQLRAFQLGEWSHPIFQQKDWPLQALAAFLMGVLNENQISKLFLYDQCMIESPQNFPVQCFQLFVEEKKLNSEAAGLLERGLGGYFSPEEKQKLWKDLEELPLSDGAFFAVESPIFAETEESLLKKKTYDVAAYFLRMGRYPFLLVEDERRRGQQLVVPPALFEAILRSKFGPIAMKPNPVLGFFKKERLSLADRRVVIIPCRYVSQPDRVHQFSVTRLTSHHHDEAYHLFLESGNPHRPAWIELAKMGTPLGIGIQSLLFDREFPLYSRPETHQDIAGRNLDKADEKFWYSLAILLVRIEIEYGKNNADLMVSLLLDHIAQHSERWKEEHGIDLQNLKKMNNAGGEGEVQSWFTSLQAYSLLK